jgi:hypothetical protein
MCAIARGVQIFFAQVFIDYQGFRVGKLRILQGGAAIFARGIGDLCVLLGMCGGLFEL